MSGAALALAVVGISVLGDAGAATQLVALRGAAVIGCSAVAFVIDDPAANCLASSPTPMAWRRGMRVALAGASFALGWAALTRLVSGGVPIGLATLEAAAMLASTLAVAAKFELGGAAGGPALALAFLAAFLLQQRWPRLLAILVAADDPSRGTAVAHWWAVLAVSAVSLAASSRDPARPRRTTTGCR
ncbi:MAG: hypothetical protein M3N98_04300 [Actinomycetota bacterium]|nr:hypothetical protein [Actinomycetota bacterium]